MLPIADSDLKTTSRPYVNLALIAICAVVFIYGQIIGGSERAILFYRYGVIPSELSQGLNYVALEVWGGHYVDIATPFSNWVTIFTSMFIHGSWLHFLGNMLFLWVFGDNVEDRFGHFRYLLFYLAAGVAGVWLQIATSLTSENPMIGASGAIAGVLGAYLFLFPYSRIRTAVIFFFIVFVRIPAFLLLSFWFVLQFFGGLGSLPSADSGGVAYWAHIGGFLTGIIVVIIYKLGTGQGLWPRGPGGGVNAPPEVKYWRGRPL